MHYNPLAYIKNEADILKFVDALISNTKGEGKEGDPFWTKSETLLYCALIAYIIGKVDGIKNLDLITLFLLEKTAHLGQHPALGIDHHERGMSLEQLGPISLRGSTPLTGWLALWGRRAFAC